MPYRKPVPPLTFHGKIEKSLTQRIDQKHSIAHRADQIYKQVMQELFTANTGSLFTVFVSRLSNDRGFNTHKGGYMFLTRLVYASTVSEDFSPADIEQILVSARKSNSKAGVTGMLCFNRKYFLQCLEGSRSNVNYIYHKIQNDPRHSNILMLNYQEIDVREFSEWLMGYIPESSLTTSTNIKFSGSSEFNPYAISGASAYQMMLYLKDSVPSI